MWRRRRGPAGATGRARTPRSSLDGVLSTFTPAHRGGSGPPMVCLHGFTGSWRTWELVLPMLERHHDVLAPTLAGHAGGPSLDGAVTAALLPDAVERAMDAAGFETAHVVGNSLGGFVALQLAARGRARSVVALAPAGGWADRAEARATLEALRGIQDEVEAVAPHAAALVATPEGRRTATMLMTSAHEHIPSELIAHHLRAGAGCEAARPMLEYAITAGYELDAERITCPVRVVWGTEDRLLPWPSAAARFRTEWVPQADWIELDGVGHCPQLDVPLETAQLILGFTT
jgi:pimeloyl-ACP methyl ester carboxylesterase